MATQPASLPARLAALLRTLEDHRFEPRSLTRDQLDAWTASLETLQGAWELAVDGRGYDASEAVYDAKPGLYEHLSHWEAGELNAIAQALLELDDPDALGPPLDCLVPAPVAEVSR